MYYLSIFLKSIIHITTFIVLQGKAKSKMIISKATKEDETVPSTCHVTDGNGCSEVNGDLDTKLESAEVPEENGVDKKFDSDERPLKKAKSVDEENCSSAKANNGGLAFIPIVH